MTTWIATAQDNKLADKSSEIESTHATSAADLQLDGNEYQALRGFGRTQAGASRSLFGQGGSGSPGMPGVVGHDASPCSGYEQYVAVGAIQQVLGNAAEQPLVQHRAAMLADDDQIAIVRLFGDMHSGIAMQYDQPGHRRQSGGFA